MAITFGAVTRGTSTGTSSLSYSFTVDANTTSLWVCISHSRGADSVSGVTWNGNTMTRGKGSFANVGAYIYYLENPTPATGNVVVSISAGTDRGLVASAFNAFGTLTSGVLGVTAAANGVDNTPTVTVVTGTNNSVVIDAMTQVFITNTITVDGSQTQLTNQNQAGTSQGETACASYELKATAGSTVMSWSSDTSNQWDSCAVEIKAAVNTVKTIDGLATASVKTVDGLAIASVKTFNGLSTT